MLSRCPTLTSQIALVACLSILPVQAHADETDDLRSVVDGLAGPFMRENAVPGMAVAIRFEDDDHVFTYGVSEADGTRPVGEDTIFEIGSLSKTYTATLAAYAEATGALAMIDPASALMPELAGSAIGEASLLDLGTYSAGGLPLQFPDDVADEDDMIAFYRDWQPEHAPGTTRLYSNPSIGLFGLLTAQALGGDFAEEMQTRLLPAFGLSDTFVTVPAERMADYAYGLTRDGETVRVNPGMLDAEAYGIKTTGPDILGFLKLQLDPSELPEDWRQAVEATQEPRYRVGATMQGLGWELYRFPASIETLLAGNSTEMALEPKAIEPLDAQADGPFLVNKTGSTGGFGAYALLVPSEGIGIAILANRNVPIPARIALAQGILTHLERDD